MGYEIRSAKQVKAEVEGGVSTPVEPSLSESIRSLRKGRALFVPSTFATLATDRRSVAANASAQKRVTGNAYSTMTDEAREGIWVIRNS